MKVLRSEIHKRKHDVIKTINKAVAIREASRVSRDSRLFYQSVLGTPTERYTMTYFKTPDGRVVSDEKDINKQFAMPEYAKASSLHVSEPWHEAVESEEAFLVATASSGVFEELRKDLDPDLLLET